MLCGMFCPQLFSEQALSRRLGEIKASLKKNRIVAPEISLVLFLNGVGWEPKTALKLLARLRTALGQKVHLISWQKMLRIASLSGYAVAGIHDTALCVDSYFIHHAFNKGAIPLDPPPALNASKLEADRMLPLSPSYGIRIYQTGEAFSERGALKNFRSYLDTLSKPAETQAVPPWFIQAVRDSGLPIL